MIRRPTASRESQGGPIERALPAGRRGRHRHRDCAARPVAAPGRCWTAEAGSRPCCLSNAKLHAVTGPPAPPAKHRRNVTAAARRPAASGLGPLRKARRVEPNSRRWVGGGTVGIGFATWRVAALGATQDGPDSGPCPRAAAGRGAVAGAVGRCVAGRHGQLYHHAAAHNERSHEQPSANRREIQILHALPA
jgi:hypothetical protein